MFLFLRCPRARGYEVHLKQPSRYSRDAPFAAMPDKIVGYVEKLGSPPLGTLSWHKSARLVQIS